MENRKMQIGSRTPDEIKDNLSAGLAVGGQRVYNSYCISCHQLDGKGDGNRFPPLNGSEWVTGDKERLIGLVLEGLTGTITVKGQSYNNVMPKHDFVSDAEIAQVLSYIRMSFTNNASAVREKEVTQVRSKLASVAANKK